ncbi:MAG: hypothetical protein ACXVZ1_11025 [Gaiellaceae bacterium]
MALLLFRVDVEGDAGVDHRDPVADAVEALVTITAQGGEVVTAPYPGGDGWSGYRLVAAHLTGGPLQPGMAKSLKANVPLARVLVALNVPLKVMLPAE